MFTTIKLLYWLPARGNERCNIVFCRHFVKTAEHITHVSQSQESCITRIEVFSTQVRNIALYWISMG